MPTIKCFINDIPVEVEEGTTILKAAREVGIKIPTLCHHPDLTPTAACGICIVKLKNSHKTLRACAAKVADGMEIITHDPEIVRVRRTVIELILSTHPNDCLQCARSGNCELQTLASEFGIREVPFESNINQLPKDDTTPSIVLNPEKCIKCGRCVEVCQEMQNVWAVEFLGRGDGTRIAPAADCTLDESPCVKCGQCSAHCPVGAIYEKDETRKVWDAIHDPEAHVVVQIAPAVRVAIGEAFENEPGTITTKKIYSALRRIGADTVFDTNFSADLTIMEEGSEFVQRLTNNGELPLITSCCPAWVDYMEKYYNDMIPNFSTAKSPQQMMGAMIKSYFAEKEKIDPKKIVSVSIMPCTAKKYEITRDDNMEASGFQDVDIVLTTRELARMFKSAGVDFNAMPEENADKLMGTYTGAGTIFGATGGVMEAALRTAYNLVTKEELEDIDFVQVRGLEGIKEAEIDIKGTKIRIAVAHGLKNVQFLMDKVREAKKEGKEMPWHFIEVMACRGGCIGGGGQPYMANDEVRNQRIKGIYSDDSKCEFRKSHQNPEIQAIYKDYLGEPLSHKSHELLHTKYQDRPLYQK